MDDKKKYVVPMDEVRDHIGYSNQADYILNKYLSDDEINSKTAIIEERYIDKDYLMDYAGFYSRSFEKIERCSKRIHFFSEEFDQEFFEDLLINFSQEKLKKLGKYIGFVVLKPFRNQDNDPEPLIGRTVLSTLEGVVKGSQDIRKYIMNRNTCSIYGIKFNIDALPFQAQDRAVAACATTSLWITNNQLLTLFQTPRLSPIEVTNRAASYIEYARNLPNTGLTIKQMLSFLKSIEMDFEFIDPYDMRKKYPEEIKKIVPDTIKTFVDAEIPIIAGLNLVSYDDDKIDQKTGEKIILASDFHAVVICGYRENVKGEINKIYIHDDQIGPYSKVENASEEGYFLKWENEWTKDTRFGPMLGKHFDEVILFGLILPLYPKIRLSYLEVYNMCHLLRQEHPTFNYHLRLISVQNYKKELLLNPKIQDKLSILKKSLPRFMWVISTFENGNNTMDFVLDATSHRIRKIVDVYYTVE